MNAFSIKRVAYLMFFLVAAALLAAPAEAQHRTPSALSAAEWSAPAVVLSLSASGVPTAPVSFERVLVGSALGTVAGAAAGAGLALLMYAVADQSDGAMFGPLGEMVLIGLPVTAIGTAIGSYRGARGEVSPWIAAGGAVLGVGLGFGLGVLVGDAVGPGAGEYLGAATGAVVAVTVPAVLVWSSAR